MAYITTRKEWAELYEDVLDEDTGLTRADWIEYQYDGDIEFIDDIQVKDGKLEIETTSA